MSPWKSVEASWCAKVAIIARNTNQFAVLQVIDANSMSFWIFHCFPVLLCYTSHMFSSLVDLYHDRYDKGV